MSKKVLKPLKVDCPEKFGHYLRALWDELFWASVYYDVFKEARQHCQVTASAVRFSPYFWDLSLRAYCLASLTYLHRIYDQDEQSFNLHRFLLTVRENPQLFDPTEVRKRLQSKPEADDLMHAIGTLDRSTLDRDIWYASTANPKVHNLKTWRDRVTFHKDERELFRQRPFESDYPLEYADIDELLEKGFEILNRYSQHFDTSVFGHGCREWKDMKFVFEAIKQHADAVRR